MGAGADREGDETVDEVTGCLTGNGGKKKMGGGGGGGDTEMKMG